MRRSFPEVKWVFFCCCFVHFCPFGQSKLRQFAIVWLHSQSSCMWHWVHNNTPPPKKTTPPPLLCGTMRTSRLQFSRYFWHSVKTCWTRDKYSTDGSGLDLDWMTTCFSQLVLGRVTLKKKKKYKTVVFIATVALSYANWPCWFNYGKAAGQSRRKNSASSVKGKRDVVCVTSY